MHTVGGHYVHEKRPAWGKATFLGEADGNLRFEFADGARKFKASHGHLMRPAHEGDPAGPRVPRKPSRPRRAGGPPRQWTKERDTALMGWVDSGASDKEMAAAMGVTEHAVRCRRHRLQVEVARGVGRRWTQEDDELADRLRTQGLSSAEIGERLDRSEQAISHRLWSKRQGEPAPTKRGRWTAQEDQAINSGRPDLETAAALGRSQSSVRARRRRLAAAGS